MDGSVSVAVCGTEIAYDAMRCAVLRSRMVLYQPRVASATQAIHGTDLEFATSTSTHCTDIAYYQLALVAVRNALAVSYAMRGTEIDHAADTRV
eukprot:1288032-Rhodomonas_salina.2